MKLNFNKTLHSSKGHKIQIDDRAMYGCWEYPDGSEGGGLWFANISETKVELSDYDGVYALHPTIITALREAGYFVDEVNDA